MGWMIPYGHADSGHQPLPCVLSATQHALSGKDSAADSPRTCPQVCPQRGSSHPFGVSFLHLWRVVDVPA